MKKTLLLIKCYYTTTGFCTFMCNVEKAKTWHTGSGTRGIWIMTLTVKEND